MKFDKVLKKYLYIFYITGFTGYDPYSETKRNCFNWSSAINKFLTFSYCLMAIVSFGDIIIQLFFVKVNQLVTPGTITWVVYFLFAFLTLTSLRQVNRHKENFRTIHQLFDELNKMFKYKLRQDTIIERFKMKFNRKIGNVFLSTVVLMTLYIVGSGGLVYKTPYSILVSRILRFMTLFTSFYMIFFVDLLRHFIDIFCHTVDGMAKVQAMKMYTKHEQVAIQLKYFKIIHLKLWTVAYLISESFGWIMVVNFLNYPASALNSLFWAYVLIHTDPNWMILGNSSFF